MPGSRYGQHADEGEATPLVADRTRHEIKLSGTLIVYRTVVALAFVGLSMSMIFYNKYLMAEDHFPFPTVLVTLQMIIMFPIMLCVRWAMPSLFPSADILLQSPEKIGLRAWAVFPLIGAFATGAIVLGNTAYRFSAVSFLQMIKEANLVSIYAVSVMFGLQPLAWRPFMVIVFIACSAVCAVSQATTFSAIGLLVQGCGSLCGAMQIVLTQRVMTEIEGIKIDPMTMVLCLAPMMLITLLPVNLFTWDPQIPERFMIWWPLVLANIGLAMMLQVASTFAVRELSATGQSLASIGKDMGIVFLSKFSLHEPVAPMQMLGFAGCISGSILFTSIKLMADAPPKQYESTVSGGASQAILCSLPEHPRDADKVV